MKSEEEKPPSTAFKKLKNLISFKPKSLNEVSEVLQHALNTNIIDKEAQLIAEKAIRLGDTTLKEIMIPKVEMVTVDVNESQDVFINRIIESGHSRYPVMGENKNEVKGLLLAKDILPALHSKTPISLEKVTRNIKVVPENKKADTMLEEFKNDRSHMAVVIDEYGSVSGLSLIHI